MGLDIYIKGLGYNETYHGGYIFFNVYRCEIAKVYNRELGEIYAKLELTDADIDRYNELCNEELDLFLLHSDCGGKLTWKECRAIYKVMKDLPFAGDDYGTRIYAMHELWLNMFKYCWKRRVTMWFR